jgi:hypothetical protein
MPFKLNPTTGKLDFYEETTTLPAVDITYNNTNSGLIATNTQSAIDELTGTKYAVNSLQHFQGPLRSWLSEALRPNMWHGIPLEVLSTTKVSNLKWFIVTGAVGDSVIGLYDMVNGTPTNLLFQTTVFNNNVTGLITYTFPSPITLKKGRYVLVHLSSSNPTIRTSGNSQGYSWMGVNTALNLQNNFWTAYWGNVNYSTYAGTLPALWPSASVGLYLAGNINFTTVGFTITS